MRGAIIYLALHLVQTYGLEDPKCGESHLLVEQKYCDKSTDNSTSTLTMKTGRVICKFTVNLHTSYNINHNVTEVNLTEGCAVSHLQVGNNDTFYLDCETEYINCEEDTHGTNGSRQVFIVECDNELLNVIVNPLKKMGEEEKKDLTVPILAGTSAAALGTVGMGFLLYKLKTLLQSGTYLFPPA